MNLTLKLTLNLTTKLKFLLLMATLFTTANLQADTFEQNCKIMGEDDVVQMTVELNTENLLHRVTAFEEENCQKPYLIFDRVYETPENQNQVVSLVHLKSMYTPLSIEVARAMNLIKYCGLRTWTMNQSQDVTGKKCDDFQQLSAGEKTELSVTFQPDFIYFDNAHDPIPYALKRL